MPLDALDKDGASGAFLTKADAFVDSLYVDSLATHADRPFVTLTWAQTLDAKIASAAGEPRLYISGAESMGVTMRLRCQHDALMIGIQTLLDDDPRLIGVQDPLQATSAQTRQVRDLPITQVRQPRPVILDPLFKTPPDCRMMQQVSNKVLQPPILLASAVRLPKDEAAQQRRHKLEQLGALVLEVEETSDGRLDLQQAMTALRKNGVKRVMVEGGARIISSFLAQSELVDSVVVTVGPVFAPAGGRGPVIPAKVRLRPVRTEVLGQDAVMACEIER